MISPGFTVGSENRGSLNGGLPLGAPGQILAVCKHMATPWPFPVWMGIWGRIDPLHLHWCGINSRAVLTDAEQHHCSLIEMTTFPPTYLLSSCMTAGLSLLSKWLSRHRPFYTLDTTGMIRYYEFVFWVQMKFHLLRGFCVSFSIRSWLHIPLPVSYLCLLLYLSPDKDIVCPSQGEEKEKKESLSDTADSTLVSLCSCVSECTVSGCLRTRNISKNVLWLQFPQIRGKSHVVWLM